MSNQTTFSPSFIFTIILLSILIFACGNDDDGNGNDGDTGQTPEFYVERPLLSCPFEVVDFSNVSFQVNQAYEYEGLVIGGGYDNMFIFNPATEALTEIDTIGVKQFLEFEGKLMICTDEGLYSLNPQQDITLETNQRCHSMLLSSDGTFLMTGANDKILSWNSTEGIMPHTDAHQTNFLDMFNLMELSNGELWAITGNGKIARFKDQLFLDFYDLEDIPMSEFVVSGSMFMAAYEEGAILVTKNGTLYQIFKYTNNQEWVALFDSESAANSDETRAIIVPSVTDILVLEDELYVATTLASCKGFQVFNISKDELLGPEDYHPQFDTSFESHCINGLNVGANGDVFTVANNQVLIYDCN